MMLSDIVRVAPDYQRSVRIDADLEFADALNGFVCQGSSRFALETMANHIAETKQRAFTWTGPYGSGKSSLALALCASVGSDKRLRTLARSRFGDIPSFERAFPVGTDGWLVVPVVGRRSDPIDDLRVATSVALNRSGCFAEGPHSKTDHSGRDVIEQLQREASARPNGGVLVVLDEMGKFLDAAASEGTDIHCFQELAEAASRSKGRLIILGILHQAFEQYASRHGRKVRDEWAKVQGRFIDIPIVAPIDEIIDLIGLAIDTDAKHTDSILTAERVSKSVIRRRPSSPTDLATRLDSCWPLHPVTTIMLGPLSRRRFGQNERGTFGFLGSREPEGFQDFLRGSPATSGESYEPARLWDHLRVNLEPAILASPDGHRWLLGAEAVERCESRGSTLHVRLAKTIALVDLFRDGSGLVPERTILEACVDDVDPALVEKALRDLEKWSIVIFRKHLDAWAIYGGSDFDISEAVETAVARASGINFARLAQLADLQPLLAKEHYFRTGTLRWFETGLTAFEDLKSEVQSFNPLNGSSGKFLMAIPGASEVEQELEETCRQASEMTGLWPVAIGVPPDPRLIREMGSELVALEWVRTNRPELEGDQVARREVASRIAAVSAQLEEKLRASFDQATWFVRGKSYERTEARSLARLVSQLVDETFPKAPVVQSELVNRERPSSNIQGAVRRLLHAMVGRSGEECLGIQGFPAERGLYSTVLDAAGMHGPTKDGLGIKAPNECHPVGSTFLPMWQRAEHLLEATCGPVPLSELYSAWTVPPYGIRRGLLPILAMTFILARRTTVALYVDGTFQTEINDVVADRLLQNEKLISLRYVVPKADNLKFMRALAKSVGEITGKRPQAEPLAVAHALVGFAFRLPHWTRRTSSISKTAQAVRRILMSASDPHRLLFVDLPYVAGSSRNRPAAAVAAALAELANAYPKMLSDVRDRLLNALAHTGSDYGELRSRAQVASGVSGDLRLEAFVTRIAEFDGRDEDIESVAGLVVNKPTRNWSDLDPNKAALELAELALRFRQVEILSRVQCREPTRHAIAVVFGTGEAGRTIMKSVDVSEKERVEVTELAEKVVSTLKESQLNQELLLAALAEAGFSFTDSGSDDLPMVIAR